MKILKRSALVSLVLASTYAFAANTDKSTETQSNAKPSFSQAQKSVKKSWVHVGYNNLWTQIAHDFSLPHYTNSPEVKKQIRWFQKHPEYLQKVGKYGQDYMYYIYHEVKRRNLPTELALLPIIESAYDPFAYSWVGAAGIWQIMPRTGKGFGLKQDWWYDGRKAIEPSTRAALDYLTYLNSFFNGNWLLAIASYNAGEGTVQNAVNRNARRGKGTAFWDLRLPAETEAYVPKLLAIAAIVQDPKKYGVTLPFIPNKPFFGEVLLDKQIDMKKAAQMAGISLDELYELNPGYKRWATDPNGPYRLLLPIDSMNKFEEQLAKEEGINPLVWRYITVSGHDTLASLSKKYNTSADAIKKVNHLKSTKLHHGQTLLIPSNVKKASAPDDLTPNPNENKGKRHSLLNYQIEPGDSLWKIAKKQHMTIDELRALNHLSKGQNIEVGQSLLVYGKNYLPELYTVKSGDTLSSIAKKHHTSANLLEAKNHLTADSTLHPGQKLVL